MKEIGPVSWDECISVVKLLQAECKKNQESAPVGSYYSDLIFRGQGNSEWELETTLERYLKEELGADNGIISAKKYYMALDRAIPSINSFAGKNFSRIEQNISFGENIISLPHYELMSYARHHGFPSPLLDWSRSLYVACFFATSGGSANSNPALYVFQEWTGQVKTYEGGTPQIQALGPYVDTHQRHFRQQSEYTFCYLENENSVHFCPHKIATEQDPAQNVITKIVIKHESRREILLNLAEMNITDYTIYGNEEGLMKAKAFDVFIRDGRW